MSTIFQVNMLPAEEGDCLVVEYGEPGKIHRILVDTGTENTCKAIVKYLGALPEKERTFELFILSHVDDDHIGGLMKLINVNVPNLYFDDIWFNGWKHLSSLGAEELGPVQGEMLTSWLVQNDLPWNKHFKGGRIAVSDTGELPEKTLGGGMKLTVLSPGYKELANLRPKWKKLCRQVGLDPALGPQPKPATPAGFESLGAVDIEDLAIEPFRADSSESNGSSIAVLAEYEGHSILLTGDAFPSVLIKNIDRIAENKKEKQLVVDAMKMPHHGSKGNTSRKLIEKVNSSRYLISTNGNVHHHPDAAAVARVIKFSRPHPELVFNYRTEQTEIWDDQGWIEKYGYHPLFPNTGTPGIMLEL
jgi:beta-lactamase superfamily II metal-dependent hydrolase